MSADLCVHCGMDWGKHKAGPNPSCQVAKLANGSYDWHPTNTFTTSIYQKLCANCGFPYGKHSAGGSARCPISDNSVNQWNPTSVYKDIVPGAKAAVAVAALLGMKCGGRYCGEYNPYGAPNQPDGKTYLCHSCRGKPACMR